MVYGVLFVFPLLIVSLLLLVRLPSFEVPAQVALFSGGLSRSLESEVDHDLPIRRLGINLWAALSYAVFREGKPGVVVGRHGWLFTDEEFTVPEQGPTLVAANLERIRQVHRLLQRRGITLVMVVVPAKARIYSDRLGHRRPALLHRQAYATLMAFLDREGIPAPDLARIFMETRPKGLLYFPTDTHWTPLGARTAARATARIMEDWRSSLPAVLFASHRKGSRSLDGDLRKFVPLGPLFSWLMPSAESLNLWQTEPVDPAEADDLLGDQEQAIDVVLVGTSYSALAQWNFVGFLKEALHADLLDYSDKGQGPFPPMAAWLRSDDCRQAPPRLVIWEFPERYLPRPGDGDFLLARHKSD